MADERGKLTADEQKKALTYLRQKLKVKTCPMCGDDEPALSDSVSALPLMGPQAITAHSFTPALMTVCNNCGYIRFFSAIMAGVVPKTPAQQPPEQ